MLTFMLTLLFLLLFIVTLFFLGKRKAAEIPFAEKEKQRICKKYGEVMAASQGETSPGSEKIVILDSMEDLIKVADILGKPVVHVPVLGALNTHLYQVYDGALKYQYVLSDHSLEAEANMKDQEGKPARAEI